MGIRVEIRVIYSNLSNNRLGENGFGSVVMWGFCD